MTRPKYQWFRISSLSAALLTLAACGGANASSPSAPIIIGATIPLTGNFSHNGEQLQNAYQLAVDDFNAKGGINGRKIRLVVEDDQSNATAAATNTKKLIVEEHAVALLGEYGSDAALASSAVAEQYSVPNIQAFASSPQMTSRGFKFVFNTYPVIQTLESAAADFIANVIKPTKVALIYDNETAYITGNQAAVAELKKAGLDPVVNDQVPQAQPNYTAAVLHVKQAGAQALMLETYANDTTVIIKELKELNVPLMGVYVNGPIIVVPAVVSALGSLLETVSGSPTWYPGEQLGTSAQLAARAEQKYGTASSAETVYGYAAAQILFAAIQKAGVTQGSKVGPVMHSTKFDSIVGNVNFQPSGQAVPALVGIAQYQKMKPVLVWPSSVAVPYKPFVPWTSR